MSTHRSSGRRRLGLALAPAAVAALALTGSASAAPTCVLPSEVVSYGLPTGLPTCLPNLELNKLGPATAGPGVIEWKIVVYHTGYPGAAENIDQQKTMNLPGIPLSQIHVDDTTLNLTGLQPDKSYGIPADGMLYPGHAVVYTVKEKLSSKICSQKSISNSAAMTVDVPQSTTADDSHTVTVPVRCTTDVGITKTADKATYAPGEKVTWTVTVTNNGGIDIPVSRIQVTDADVVLTPAPGNPSDTLPAGQSMVYTATAALTTAQCGQIKNTASVSLTGTGPIDDNASNNQATAVAMVAGSACTPPSPTSGTPGAASTSTPGTTSGTPGNLPATGTPTGGAVCPRVSIGVGISTPRKPYAGQITSVLLTVKARNDASKVQLIYRLPGSFVVVSKPQAVKMRGGTILSEFGNMRAGSTAQVKLTVRIVRTAQGRRQHTASVTAKCASTARAAVATTVRPLQGGVNPAVTG